MIPINYPKYISVLKNKNNILGFQHRTKNYIMGFQQPKHAYLVQKNICYNSIDKIMLLRHHIENVGSEVSNGLKAIGLDESYDDITIDLDASLIIPKNNDLNNNNLNNNNLNINLIISELKFEDFLMYPFNKHIGVSLSYELEEEKDSNYLIFTSQVIDPCNDIKLFREKLHI